MRTFGGLEMGIFGFGKKKIEEEKEVNLSRREFLEKLGVIGAGIALAPGLVIKEAFASNMRGWPTAIVKSDYQIVRIAYEKYLNNVWGKETALSILSCQNHEARERYHIEEAFANDPTMAYVAELFNYRDFKGQLSFGHDGEKRYGASNQRDYIYKNNPTMSDAIWTIYYYFQRFKKNKENRLYANIYETLSFAFYNNDNQWEAIKYNIENGQPISTQFHKPKDKSHKLAALWAAGILSRTYEREGEIQKSQYAKTLLEEPIAKQVGYSLGKLDF